MLDREKVIKDIEECLSASCRGYRPRLSCPYNDDEWDIMRDALALLKEQEAVEPYEAEMMITHDDGSVEYLKDIDSVMLLAHMDYQITYTGEF